MNLKTVESATPRLAAISLMVMREAKRGSSRMKSAIFCSLAESAGMRDLILRSTVFRAIRDPNVEVRRMHGKGRSAATVSARDLLVEKNTEIGPTPRAGRRKKLFSNSGLSA